MQRNIRSISGTNDGMSAPDTPCSGFRASARIVSRRNSADGVSCGRAAHLTSSPSESERRAVLFLARNSRLLGCPPRNPAHHFSCRRSTPISTTPAMTEKSGSWRRRTASARSHRQRGARSSRISCASGLLSAVLHWRLLRGPSREKSHVRCHHRTETDHRLPEESVVRSRDLTGDAQAQQGSSGTGGVRGHTLRSTGAGRGDRVIPGPGAASCYRRPGMRRRTFAPQITMKTSEHDPDLKGLAAFTERGDREDAVFFVGRDHEIGAVERLCARAQRAIRAGERFEGATLLFQGAPGAGKTALLSELQHRWLGAPATDDAPGPVGFRGRPARRRTLERPRLRGNGRTGDTKGGGFPGWTRPPARHGRATRTPLPASPDGFVPANGPARPRLHQRSPFVELAEAVASFHGGGWPGPVCLMVDEIQATEQGRASVLGRLHEGVPGLPIVPLLAGLGSSEDRLSSLNVGLSRLSQRGRFTASARSHPRRGSRGSGPYAGGVPRRPARRKHGLAGDTGHLERGLATAPAQRPCGRSPRG